MLSFVHIVLYMFNSKKKKKNEHFLKIKNSEIIHVFMQSLLPGRQYSFLPSNSVDLFLSTWF